jgi:SAM-dependent methyltransferase
MALMRGILRVYELLRTSELVGPGKTQALLELGEQNWFGDVEPAFLRQWIDDWCPDRLARDELAARLQGLLSPTSQWWLFDLARLFYDLLLGPHEYLAIDLHGTPAAKRYDLNQPLPLEKQFDLVTNIGTAEHVFDQCQLFRSMHDWTAPGGLMVHYFPNQGCFDHGFYNYHPTFVFDLCDANRYAIVLLAHYDNTQSPPMFTQIHARADYVRMAVAGQLSTNSALIAVLRMPDDPAAFSIPMQGYYTEALPSELKEAWQHLQK